MPALSIKGKLVSGGTDASELTQKINTINDSIANILGDFATIEPTATASKAYEIGKRLVLNGLYYKVTAAISQGDQLVVDGNIEKTTVGDDITALSKDLANYYDYDVNNATVQNAWGSLFVTPLYVWNSVLPAGKTADDIKSVMWIGLNGSHNAFLLLTGDGFILARGNATTGLNGKIRIKF